MYWQCIVPQTIPPPILFSLKAKTIQGEPYG